MTPTSTTEQRIKSKAGRPKTGESPELLHRNALWWWMVNQVGLPIEVIAHQQGYTAKTVTAGVRFTAEVIRSKSPSARVLAEALGLAEMLGLDDVLPMAESITSTFTSSVSQG